MEKVAVSILCTTYNHKDFIRKCLDSLVSQRTSLPYEILVHDDASTDGTTDIIREFEQMYPHLIKPIYQTENQYSQGIKIGKTFLYPRSKGKYIAFCEGDDCWTDEEKLQLQFDFLESHPQYKACCHRATWHDCVTNREHLFPNIHKDREISVKEAVLGGGAFVSTNSIFFNKDLLITQPSCFLCPKIGDYQLAIYGAINGLYYLNRVMSQYNCYVKNSWTCRESEKSVDEQTKTIDNINAMLKKVDVYYGNKYSQFIQAEILINLMRRFHTHSEYKKFLSKEYKPLIDVFPIMEKIKFYFYAYFPWMKKTVKFLKKQIHRIKE